ncbi:MAG TPA: hypothetical protein VK735_15260 [Pseudonocardia sp.]|uniref:hypothetical protein n=1 Tax=Pseudonocardia sp. TaxID=60912 RepID=UPI002BE18081|nr:hypothetical protein [Pseudonocardia sp.]HTF48802.1 hypothetical protein [Pseudonocardia sp.]
MARHARRPIRWGRAAVVIFISLVLSWGLNVITRALGVPGAGGWLSTVLSVAVAVLVGMALAPWYLNCDEEE